MYLEVHSELYELWSLISWSPPQYGNFNWATQGTMILLAHCMSHSLNSLKGGHVGDYYKGIKGDIRNLDYSSNRAYTPTSLDS